MAITVIQQTSTSTRWVWAGDPSVTAPVDVGWVSATDASYTDDATVIEVHALSAEQAAIVGSVEQPASYYEAIRRARPRVRHEGKWLSASESEAFISGLHWSLAAGLHLVVLALTYADDPDAAQARLYGAGDED